MKTLVESIFGNNIASDPNITDVEVAVEYVVEKLEKALKMKAINVMTDKNPEDKVWKDGAWCLSFSPAGYADVASIIYLQYNYNYVADRTAEYSEAITCPIRFFVRIDEARDEIILKDIGCEAYTDYEYQVGVDILDDAIPHDTPIKDIRFNTNTKNIVTFIINCFTDFKDLVDRGAFEKMVEDLYLKNIGNRGGKSRQLEQDAVSELHKNFRKIIKK
jgi:hypothetical protein